MKSKSIVRIHHGGVTRTRQRDKDYETMWEENNKLKHTLSTRKMTAEERRKYKIDY